MALTPAEKMANFRARKKAEGWREIRISVPENWSSPQTILDTKPVPHFDLNNLEDLQDLVRRQKSELDLIRSWIRATFMHDE